MVVGNRVRPRPGISLKTSTSLSMLYSSSVSILPSAITVNPSYGGGVGRSARLT
jgi:hypothetical protein